MAEIIAAFSGAGLVIGGFILWLLRIIERIKALEIKLESHDHKAFQDTLSLKFNGLTADVNKLFGMIESTNAVAKDVLTHTANVFNSFNQMKSDIRSLTESVQRIEQTIENINCLLDGQREMNSEHETRLQLLERKRVTKRTA